MIRIALLFTLLPLLSYVLIRQEKIKIYLAGDSTMSDKEVKVYPETGWGMPFAAFFDSTAIVDNRAKNGRSTKSFIAEGRWQAIMDQLKEGDYVLIQFGHNDEVPSKTTYTPEDQFAANLMRFITESQSKKANPILITPVARRKFDSAGQIVETHAKYAAIVRKVASQQRVPLIDLDKESQQLVQQFGPDNSKLLFNWLAPGQNPNYPEGKQDDTHFDELGARRMAELVLNDIRRQHLALADHIVVPASSVKSTSDPSAKMSPGSSSKSTPDPSGKASPGSSAVATPTEIDPRPFADNSGHWYAIFDSKNIINALPDRPRYKPTEVAAIADNILLFQKNNGGWPKNYDVFAILTPGQKDSVAAARNILNTTYDNGSTYTQIAALAIAYGATKAEKYKVAASKGLDFILASQYRNGGWPQYYPLESGYSRCITYNDGVFEGIFIGTDIGLRFKTVRGRGGIVEKVYVKNITMRDIVHQAVFPDMYYFAKPPSIAETYAGKAKAEPLPLVTEATPQFRDIHISNVTCDGAEEGIFVRGLPEMSIRDIYLENMVLKTAKGAELTEAQNISLKNIRLVTGNTNPVIYVENSHDLHFDHIGYNAGSAVLFSVNGDRSAKIRVAGTDTSKATVPTAFHFGAVQTTMEIN